MDTPNLTPDSNSGYHFFAHTSDQVFAWAASIESDPARGVRRLQLGQKLAGDDTKEDSDFYAALTAVADAALGDHAARVPSLPIPSKAIWAGLVKVGVVEALCKNILEMVQTQAVHHNPGFPVVRHKETQDSVFSLSQYASLRGPVVDIYLSFKLSSPYRLPFEALNNAAGDFAKILDATDNKVISVLKKNWSQMMKRVRHCFFLAYLLLANCLLLRFGNNRRAFYHQGGMLLKNVLLSHSYSSVSSQRTHPSVGTCSQSHITTIFK